MNKLIQQINENNHKILEEENMIQLEIVVERPIFQAYIQRRPDFNPNMQDEYFGTIAMFKLTYCLEIEEELRHDPNIQNNKGETIEIMCHNRKIQPQDWMICDPFIRDSTGNIVVQYRNNTLKPLSRKLRNIHQIQEDKANEYVYYLSDEIKDNWIVRMWKIHLYYKNVLRAYDNIPNYQPYDYIL
ncbi:Hypothetical_protein [Hexamita inflata]|uniref:Hypothetical_protein n=1 Tax=Hexamita inflata TaxID=28002 RepID=A0AA86RQC1_9EUKA|nr:Hypothetical protein HINF_LOCUS58330 [Hexamita inflata]